MPSLSKPSIAAPLEFAIDPPARLAIIGAGPIGLEAALYARFLGYDISVFERGRICERLLPRRHLPTLINLGDLCSPLGIRAIMAQQEGYQPLARDYQPTVGEWLDTYLLPLAATDLLADHIHQDNEVQAVGRAGFLRGELADDPDRGDYALRVLIRDGQGNERIEEFDGLIDASGRPVPCFLGESGIPAVGELAARRSESARWRHIPPDLAVGDREALRDQRIVIVGESLDAAMSLEAVRGLTERYPATRVWWITRRLINDESPGPIEEPNSNFGDTFRQLIREANALSHSPQGFELVDGTAIQAVQGTRDETGAAPWRLKLIGKHAGTLECDYLFSNTGYRVDDRITRELHVHRCPASDRIREDALDVTMNPTVTPAVGIGKVIAEPHYHILGEKRAGGVHGLPFTECLAQIRQLFAILGDRASLDLYA
ncbi:MAG: hypothetical protein ACKO38_00315 [Planctomycetota bacterium]